MRRLIAALTIAWSPLAMSLETPSFQQVKHEGNFEVRRYEPTLIAEVTVDGEFSEAGNKGFRKLAAFIFGENTTKAKIDMTAPVAQVAQSEKIAMTAPVAQQAENGKFVINFTMPSRYKLDTLPQPLDPEVKIRSIPAKQMAIVSYSGTWSESRYQEHLVKLKTWIKGQGLETAGEPIFARFDPPWIPWFMRHNEIMLELKEATPETRKNE